MDEVTRKVFIQQVVADAKKNNSQMALDTRALKDTIVKKNHLPILESLVEQVTETINKEVDEDARFTSLDMMYANWQSAHRSTATVN